MDDAEKNSDPLEAIPSLTTNNECPECNCAFTTSQYLTSHLMHNHTKWVTVEGGGQKVIQCDICHYQSNKIMTSHMKTVHVEGVKQLRCELCPYSSALNSDLKKHVENVHENYRSHRCKDCGYAASRKDILRIHILRKHPVKKHVCNECGKAFSLKCDLKGHIERSVLCNSQRNNLVR